MASTAQSRHELMFGLVKGRCGRTWPVWAESSSPVMQGGLAQASVSPWVGEEGAVAPALEVERD